MAPQPPHPSDALQAAYRATLYEILTAPPATFRIGQADEGLLGWLRTHKARQACIITAWNPFSMPTSDEVNQQRQAALIQAVEMTGRRWLPAQGRDPKGAWPPEPSLCVLDADLHTIDEYLLNFEQTAAVVLNDTEGCQLRWHPGLDIHP